MIQVIMKMYQTNRHVTREVKPAFPVWWFNCFW